MTPAAHPLTTGIVGLLSCFPSLDHRLDISGGLAIGYDRAGRSARVGGRQDDRETRVREVERVSRSVFSRSYENASRLHRPPPCLEACDESRASLPWRVFPTIRWRHHYNTGRPHSVLGYSTPMELLTTHAATALEPLAVSAPLLIAQFQSRESSSRRPLARGKIKTIGEGIDWSDPPDSKMRESGHSGLPTPDFFGVGR